MVKLGSTRSKSRILSAVTVDIPASNHYTDTGVFESLYSAAGNLAVNSASESIVYTTKPRSMRERSNYCRHIQSGRLMVGATGSPVRHTFTTVPHVGHYVDYYAGPSHGSIAHTTAIVAAYGASQLNVADPPVYYGSAQNDINDAYQHLRPDLTKLSLPNFLLELDDVGKLFQLWKKKLSTAKNVAGLHLNYSFGWKPLMSDIRAMCDVLANLIQRLEEFEKSANVTSKSHWYLPSTSTSKSGSFNYSTSPGKCYWSGTVSRTKTAGLIYRPQPFEVTRGYEMMLRAYLDALGFELNPRILWDAIPFTFVLDWFFGIGSWLESHKYDTLELPFLYVDSYVQYKEIVQVESRLDLALANATPVLEATPPWVTYRKYFERVPIGPSESSFVGAGWRLPSLNQAELLVSLGTVLKR